MSEGAAGASRTHVFVGCYRSGDDPSLGGVGGIHVFELDPDDGSLSLCSRTASPVQAGYLCASDDRRYLYAVDERKNEGRGPAAGRASVTAFAIDGADGSLTPIASQPAIGAYPTYASIDRESSFLVVASHGSFEHVERVVEVDGRFAVENLYDDSCVCLYPLGADGGIEPVADVHVLAGHGLDPGPWPQADGHAQASPHAHAALFHREGSFVVVCDKGSDTSYVFRLDRGTRRLDVVDVCVAPPGTGPRHPAFDPTGRRLFMTNELASTVTSFDFDPDSGRLSHISHVRATAPGFEGYNEPAEIRVHPTGEFLYVNNRGEDGIVAFRIEETGDLSFVDAVPLAKSASPARAARSFAFNRSGSLLLVADRPANAIVSYGVDLQTGRLQRLAETEIGEPAFVVL